ncbi:DNA internalization-related competence protein ComEC/Rec2 [Lentibacillus sp. N15]|uniref:DNA internalization-related competence protein ComEC/Rec2 n=1 Tax=Lentibacillus songyuanensis TaxID=3136161 RepID=UPI0031BAC030
MKGFWHLPAISVAVCAVTIITRTYWFAAALLVWLLILYGWKRLGIVPVVVSLTAFLFFYTYIPVITDTEPPPTNNSASYAGKIISPVHQTDKKIDFVLKDPALKTNLLVVYFPDKAIHTKHQLQTLQHGASCEIHGKLEQPSRSTNPGEFDYSRYLRTKGISYQVVLQSLKDISCSGSDTLAVVYNIRSKLMQHVQSHVGHETAAWLTALVLGDESAIDEETIDIFQRWGLSHILAISGLHVGLIVTLLYFLLIKLNLFTKEKAQWFMFMFLPIYALIAGGEPSVWRACVMVMLFIIFQKLKLSYSLTDVLSIVFLLLIAADKYMVYHVGFQFSFLVTFGLLLSRHWLAQTTSTTIQMLQISFVAQMIILPLQVTYFFTFHPLSILLNLIVVPYFTLFVIPFMFFLLLVSPVSAITTFLDGLFSKVHHVFILILQGIDSLFYYPLLVGSISVVGALLYILLFLLFMHRLQQKQLLTSFFYGCLTVGFIIGITLKPYVNPVGSVTMLDIGQGDTFVIELPYRRGVFMVDAGAKVSFGESNNADQNYQQIIKPYFLSRGINNIDAIFLSHEDFDHIGSVPFLLEGMNVKEIVISAYFSDEELIGWKHHGTKIRRVEPGDMLRMGGQTFDVLSPSKELASPNDNSLVLYSKFGGLSWLFTGDMEKDAEHQMMAAYPNLAVDVLKVAHHGSKTSSDQSLLHAIDPAYGLISVGKNNTYGHPSPEVVGRLADSGITVFRTDEDGAVIFRFREDQGTFFKFLP